MSPGRIIALFGGLVLTEALAAVLLAEPARRLRLFVDILAVQGLIVGVAGAFLAADRPFLAAREMARRARGEPRESGASERPRWGRSSGVLLLVLGGVSFGIAALAWSVFGKGNV